VIGLHRYLALTRLLGVLGLLRVNGRYVQLQVRCLILHFMTAPQVNFPLAQCPLHAPHIKAHLPPLEFTFGESSRHSRQVPFLADYLCILIKLPFIGLPFLRSLTPLPHINNRFVRLLPFHCPYINFTFVGLSLLHNPTLSAVLLDCRDFAALPSNLLTVLRII
jgi:hypothetical protein